MFIEFRNISMTYKPGVEALKNVSFKISRGEFVFIIGRSGSGKSTIVKLITCEEMSTGGSIFLEGYDITNISRREVTYLRRNIGMVFQDFRLIATKTVFENVAFAMEIFGMSKRDIKKRVPIVLDTVGLRHKEKMLPHQLSGGEQQRVAIARAIVNGPALVIADEPTGNLDPINSEAIMAILQKINDNGTTVIVCSHDAAMVNRLKRRVLELSSGVLVRDQKAGEYNLSDEKLTNKDSFESARKGRRKLSGKHAGAPNGKSPFVRNLNMKFVEMGLTSEDAQDVPPEKDEEIIRTDTDEKNTKENVRENIEKNTKENVKENTKNVENGADEQNLREKSNEIDKKTNPPDETESTIVLPSEMEPLLMGHGDYREYDERTKEALRIATEYYRSRARKHESNFAAMPENNDSKEYVFIEENPINIQEKKTASPNTRDDEERSPGDGNDSGLQDSAGVENAGKTKNIGVQDSGTEENQNNSGEKGSETADVNVMKNDDNSADDFKRLIKPKRISKNDATGDNSR